MKPSYLDTSLSLALPFFFILIRSKEAWAKHQLREGSAAQCVLLLLQDESGKRSGGKQGILGLNGELKRRVRVEGESKLLVCLCGYQWET